MPAPSAVPTTEYLEAVEPRPRSARPRASERSPYQPRFRVVKRKSLVRSRRRVPGGVLPGPLILAIVPALCLMVYVLFWTLNVRGGYYKAELQGRLRMVKIEQEELRAEKFRRQSPGRIFAGAVELKMQPAQERQIVQLPVPQQMAQRVDGQ